MVKVFCVALSGLGVGAACYLGRCPKLVGRRAFGPEKAGGSFETLWSACSFGSIVGRALNAFAILLVLCLFTTIQSTGFAGQNISDSVSTGVVSTYTNPFGFSIADPFVLQEKNTYYMYGTTDDARGRGFDVYSSDNLVDWTRDGKCYTPTKDTWGRYNFWAPEVVKKDDAYYLHFTSYNTSEGRRNICVARADSPSGPFVDYSGPLFPGSVIDSHIYYDEKSGDYFAYVVPEKSKSPGIVGAKIADDFKSLLTTPTQCLKADYGWEDQWIEGPIIHEHKGTYYMMFSGGAWWEAEYSVGYATAPAPLGPWTKYDGNPILKNNAFVNGPGHNGLAWSPDGSELFMVYHEHAGDYTNRRVAAIDRIRFTPSADGPDVLSVPDGPSSTPQPLPSGAAPLRLAASDDFDSDKLDAKQWHIYTDYPDDWKLREGRLVITARDGDFWRTHGNGENVFLQHAPEGDFDIETSVTMDAVRGNEQAFLTLWDDEDDFIMFSAVHLNGQQFTITREWKGKPDTQVAPNPVGWPVCLRIEKRGDALNFYASADGNKWDLVGRGSNLKGIMPRYVGLGAWSPGSDRKAEAQFDWFKIIRE